VKNCTNPNNGGTHNIFSGVISLQWTPTANVMQARDWNSTGSNIITLNTASWEESVDIRYQREAGQWLSLEKWAHAGGGYQRATGTLSASNVIALNSSTLGASATNCSVGAVRIYRSTVPLASTPPSAVANPLTGVFGAYEFEDQASPAADSSGNGRNMVFAVAPTWIAEDTSAACWISAGTGVAGAPLQLAAYARGTVLTYLWSLISQPYP
jgi:hypothetical protein